MEKSLFAKIIDGEIPSTKVYEDDHVYAFLDLYPVNPGHVLLVPKKQYERLSETPPDVASKMMEVLPMLMNAVMNATGAKACNVMLNNGKEAGQVIFHTHIHIIPRFEGDGYDVWHGKEYVSDELREEYGEKIRNELS